MALVVERTDARTWADGQMQELFSEGFPEFITADRLAKQYIGRIREWFADLDLTLVGTQPVTRTISAFTRVGEARQPHLAQTLDALRTVSSL